MRIGPLYLLLTSAVLAVAQDSQRTDVRNFGFHGPVRSVMTAVEKLNPDPRPSGRRTLLVSTGPNWIAFDPQGARIETALAFNGNRIVSLSKRTVAPDGTEIWTDSDGHTSSQKTVSANGVREVTYYQDSKIQSREITHLDEKGRVVAFRSCDAQGRLQSEQSSVFDEESETDRWIIYNQEERIASDMKTRMGSDRFERWEYDPQGQLAWHLALDEDGDLLSQWYSPGYKPKLASSDSLGICHPKLCVSYKFDEKGTGRLEKTVQHTHDPAGGNLEPDSEEHYDLSGAMDEKIEIKYIYDSHGNWTSRSEFVWDSSTNGMVEVERDTRKLEYY